jgi:hypothetical protein
MAGQLNWADALTYFGGDLNVHRKPLSSAGWPTYGLLACRFLAGDTANVENADGEHAEEKLIRSSLWKTDLDNALAQRDPRSEPMLILLAINRSPCADCAHLLANALHRLNDKYALTTERQHFILASLGYYHSNKDIQKSERGLPQTFTTDKGMRKLREAGWKLCTLSFDGQLTPRGRQLDAYFSRMGRHA